MLFKILKIFSLEEIIDSLVHKLNLKLQVLRGKIFTPILKKLNQWKFTGDKITNIRLVLGVIFLWWFYYGNQALAAIFLLFILSLDIFDGALARFQNKASDRGKFLDVLVDISIYTFIILGFLQLSIDPFKIVYNLFIIFTVYILGIIKKQEFQKSDWVIKPYPRLLYLKIITGAAFFLYIFWGIDLLNFSLLFVNTLATILSIYYFIYIQVRWKKIYSKKIV